MADKTDMANRRFSTLRQIPGLIWVLGFVSMLMDISSEIVDSLGFFNLVSGIGMLFASVDAGMLWERLGPAMTFYAGAALSVIAVVLILGRSYTHD